MPDRRFPGKCVDLLSSSDDVELRATWTVCAQQPGPQGQPWSAKWRGMQASGGLGTWRGQPGLTRRGQVQVFRGLWVAQSLVLVCAYCDLQDRGGAACSVRWFRPERRLGL